MLDDHEVRSILERKISEDENLGERAGGSGHLGFVDYRLEEHSVRRITPDSVVIDYRYTVTVETEFTYYPDNPPAEYANHKRITVNSRREIVDSEDLSGKTRIPFLNDFDPEV
jgi:hypothetical protein